MRDHHTSHFKTIAHPQNELIDAVAMIGSNPSSLVVQHDSGWYTIARPGPTASSCHRKAPRASCLRFPQVHQLQRPGHSLLNFLLRQHLMVPEGETTFSATVMESNRAAPGTNAEPSPHPEQLPFVHRTIFSPLISTCPASGCSKPIRCLSTRSCHCRCAHNHHRFPVSIRN